MVLVKIDKLFLDILDKKHALLDYKGNNVKSPNPVEGD